MYRLDPVKAGFVESSNTTRVMTTRVREPVFGLASWPLGRSQPRPGQ